MKKTAFIFGLITVFFLSGCSTAPLTFEEDLQSTPGQKTTLYVYGITLKNQLRPCCQPRLLRLDIVEKETGKKPMDDIRWKIIPIRKVSDPDIMKATTQQSDPFKLVNTESSNLNSDGLSYILLLENKNNDKIYILRHLIGKNDSGIIHGHFEAPLHTEIVPNENGVFYSGHLSYIIRERQENEFRAGPLLPLLDQYLVGYSIGTFDVEIQDKFEKDITELYKFFPIFSDISIQKKLLSPFNRDKAQQWWEEN